MILYEHLICLLTNNVYVQTTAHQTTTNLITTGLEMCSSFILDRISASSGTLAYPDSASFHYYGNNFMFLLLYLIRVCNPCKLYL